MAVRPNVGKVGTAPSPASKDRSQRLSQVRSLGQVAELPNPAPASSEKSLPVQAGAADKYITDREQKRINGFDIPKHVRYTAANAGPASYAGSRCVDGQMLVLLRRDDAVMVLDVDDATARRLKRLPLGAQVGVDAHGVIRQKGRSR